MNWSPPLRLAKAHLDGVFGSFKHALGRLVIRCTARQQHRANHLHQQRSGEISPSFSLLEWEQCGYGAKVAFQSNAVGLLRARGLSLYFTRKRRDRAAVRRVVSMFGRQIAVDEQVECPGPGRDAVSPSPAFRSVDRTFA